MDMKTSMYGKQMRAGSKKHFVNGACDIFTGSESVTQSVSLPLNAANRLCWNTIQN